MISSFRDFTKSIVFKILMVALILSFAVFGMKDVFTAATSNDVIVAGSRKTAAADYKRSFDNYKADMEQRGGQPITYELAVKEGLHVRILEELADLDSVSAWLYKIGVRPSAKVVSDQIGKYSAFFDSVTGKFDKTKYQQTLAQQNLTETKFEQIIADDIANRQFVESAVAGLKPPRIYAAMQSAFRVESRDASFLVLTPDGVEQPGDPSDADLTKFYNDNKEKLRRPELRQFVLASFAPGDFAAKVVVDEAELKKLYEFRRDTLSTPETRAFVQITVPDQKEAQNVITGLNSGADPALLAKAHKGTLLTFENKPKTAVPDRKVADAAFALKEGETSGVIQGDLGLAVVRVSRITAGSVPGYEAVRPTLEVDYKTDKAKDLAYKASEAFEKERAAGADFVATAQKLGVKVIELPPMTAQGQMINGQSFAQFPQILKTAFEQPKGGETEVTELGNGEYYAIRVNDIIPSEVPTLDKVKPQLIQAWKAKTVMDRVVAKGDEAVARLRKGESLEAVAAAMKAKVEAKPGLQRQSAQQAVGPEIAGRVFSAKAGEVFQSRPAEAVVVVGKVTAIHNGDAAIVNQAAVMTAQGLTYGLFEDISTGTRKGARATLKTKTYPQTAVKALGLDPKEVAKAAEADQANAGKAAQ
ncbi:SurA N-terminal domain-containing protein [Asticcacaulis sp. BYS171W]|uniref:Parvulin-like PPIase n=1 Tax=Asticcacaulis aquaticus TaxID=2984212 RepID=A0ABT5HP53_9CAUL|nr:peptidylprolyl isomerase [Asticcacaulis aquaticus]MDC7681838.1 SurA N-terminal domain-containing protein [Asticcacaulis aquaticus]